jgi:hypothetical protein
LQLFSLISKERFKYLKFILKRNVGIYSFLLFFLLGHTKGFLKGKTENFYSKKNETDQEKPE